MLVPGIDRATVGVKQDMSLILPASRLWLSCTPISMPCAAPLVLIDAAELASTEIDQAARGAAEQAGGDGSGHGVMLVAKVEGC